MSICQKIFNIANISLVFMTILQIIMPIMVRFAHKTAKEKYDTKFHSTSAVCMTELIKITTCIVILIIIKETPSNLSKTLYNGFVTNRMVSLKMAVPSVIYFVQTNLYYIALNKLNAAVFTVTYQLRILTIAILAALILKKRFTLIQWGSLFVCLAGVIAVNSYKFDGSGNFDQDTMDQLVGVGLVLAMCWMSAFAGVYLEKVLKNSPDDLWLQNIRLSSVTLLISTGYISHSYLTNENYDFFQGWNDWNWIVCAATAVGGLITAAVLKYADNVRKSFCQSLAICGTSFLSIAIGDSLFTIGLSIGTVLVIVSIFVYTFGAKKPVPKEEEKMDIEKNEPNSDEKTNVDNMLEKSITLENQIEAETEPMLKEEIVLTTENGVKNTQDGA